MIRLCPLPLLLVLACGTEEAPKTTTTTTTTTGTAELVAQGKFSTTFKGAAVEIDLAGFGASQTVVHKLNPGGKGPACIVQLDLSVARKDGSCQLDLKWKRTASGMTLAEAKFYAVKADSQGGVALDTHPCAEWPKETGKGEIAYVGSSQDAGVSPGTIPAPQSGDKDAKVKDATVKFTGTVELKKSGAKFTLDLSKLSFKGTLQSQGRSDVSCGATVAFGPDQCAQKPTYGSSAGTYLKRDIKLYRCDDDEPFDFGELCGHDAIWVTSQHNWTTLKDDGRGPTMLTDHRMVYDKFKDKVGAAVILAEGATKIAVEDPQNPGKFKPDGPAPTAAECNALKAKYKLADDVVLLYDKDKKLVLQGSELQPGNFVPWALFAKGDGKLVSFLPGADGKVPGASEMEAGVNGAIEAD
jgi:hypothetical protein